MEIYVNGKSLKVTSYDDNNSILQRYSLQSKSTLPSYLRITSEEKYQIVEGARINVEDVRDELKETTLEELSESLLPEILGRYPKMSVPQVIILFLHVHYPDQNQKELSKLLVQDEPYIRKMDRNSFHNIREIVEKYMGYPKIVEEQRKEIEQKLEKRRQFSKKLNSVKKVSVGDFEMEEATLMFSIELQSGVSLMDIFDAMIVSRDVPYIHMTYKGKNWYKIYQHMSVPDDWIISQLPIDGIYFKILSSPRFKLNKGRWDKSYSDGVWYLNNTVEISFNLENESAEKNIHVRFVDALSQNIKYKIIQERQVSVKGKFTVDNFIFNRAVFADMVNNSEMFSHFFFFNERQQKFKEGYRSAITKKRFMLYYEPGQTYSTSNALTITITPYISEEGDDQWIDVRAARAENIQQVDSFREVLSRLLRIYMDNYQNVIDEYAELLPSSKSLFEKYVQKPKKQKKDDKKSGKRLRELKNKRPGVFRAGYASMCQPMSHQPYIITDASKAQAIREKYGDHKVMEFTDPISGNTDFYACQPREPGEVSTHIYPGLRKNSSKTNPEYREELPFVPCCFTEDQYTKPASELHRRIREEFQEQQIYTEEASIGEIGHILASNKLVSRGRFGQIPYYLSFVVRSSGYEEIEKGKQSILPIFRYGVVESPDSFLHCLEKAFNPRYSSLDRVGREKAVENVRISLSKMNFAVARQELYDYTDDTIRELLLEKDSYLDPGMWLRLAEIKYDCNIFIYQISKDYPNGAVVVPRFSKSYLLRDISEARKTVFIVKNSVPKDYPYQCEILVKYSPNAKRSSRFVYVFENDPLVREAIKVFYESNSVFVVTPENNFFYSPIQQTEIFEDAISQYIDDNGKTRMLRYSNGVCLMTSPLPPLDLPTSRQIITVPISKAQKFIKAKKLKIISQDGNIDDGIQGFWVESAIIENSGMYYGYIPVEVGPSIKDVQFVPPTMNDPIRTDDESELQSVNHLRKVAEFLQQYTMFKYSLNPEEFDIDSFVVDPNHKYDIDSLDKRLIPDTPVMFRGGKIIVPTKETAVRLISFLKVKLLNNSKGVMSYSTRAIVKDYYKTLNDFRRSPQQLIFLNYTSLLRWKIEKFQRETTNTLSSYLRQDVIEPYFYHNINIENGKVYLIQNVYGGNLENALGIAEKWNEDRINPGYKYITESSGKKGYSVYSEEGKGAVIPGENSKTIKVLEYSDGSYAALLPI